MAYYGKIRESDVKLRMVDTYTVPFFRHGVTDAAEPKRTADEVVREPLEKLFIPPDVLSIGAGIIQRERFRPEYCLNLLDVEFKEGVVTVTANHINYGVLPTLRKLTEIFPEETMRPVLEQLALLAVRAVTVSPQNEKIYLARRAGSTVGSGKIETFPAGTVTEDNNDLGSALMNEAFEEAGLEIHDYSAHLVGLVRGRGDDPIPNFIYMIETPWSLEQMQNGMGKEHDRIYTVKLDEREVREYIRTDFILRTPEHTRASDAGLASLLQVGRTMFGDKWYSGTVNELRDLEHPTVTVYDSQYAV